MPQCRVGDEAVAQGVRGGLVHVSEDDFEASPKWNIINYKYRSTFNRYVIKRKGKVEQTLP